MSRLTSRPVKPVTDSWLKWLSSTPDAFDDAGWPADTPEWSDTLPCARLIELSDYVAPATTKAALERRAA